VAGGISRGGGHGGQSGKTEALHCGQAERKSEGDGPYGGKVRISGQLLEHGRAGDDGMQRLLDAGVGRRRRVRHQWQRGAQQGLDGRKHSRTDVEGGLGIKFLERKRVEVGFLPALAGVARHIKSTYT
jgi:hypothetical protein